jgi:VIT1/CCC1 family predicted Fe2+/Mn2+ transporter
MFLADLFAAFVRALPFALLPLATARSVCLVVTALLLLLGVGRGIIGRKNLLVVALQTLAIATAAGLAGQLVSSLVSGRIGG